MHAVVLRAAGDRAFCAGLDTKKPYGQPDDVWNHEDPGELLSPKWQQVWKPVVCAVHGICTAGAFYFVNESDIVICSDDATFFDSHVTYGLVSALEPVGLMRKIGLGETLRIALSGNDERVTAATALRIGLVTEVVARDELWARAHEIAAGIARKPTAATQGTVRAIWESLDRPYRAAMQQGLIYTRRRQPDRHRPRSPSRAPTGPSRGCADGAASCPRSAERIAQVLALDPAAPRARVRAARGTRGATSPRRPTRSRRCVEPGERVAVLLRNRPPQVGLVLGLLRAGACVVTDEPRARDRAGARRPRVARRRHDRRRDRRPRGARAEGALVRERRARRGRRHRRRAGRRRPTREPPPRRRGRDAHERHDRAAQAGAAHLRDVLARARRRQALRAQRRRRRAAAQRRHDRELADGAPRRAVPPPAVRERRPFVLPARTLPRRRVDRRGAPPPPAHREPRARRAAHGARRRPRPRRLRERALGHLAAPRRSRPTTPTRSSRSTACRCSIAYAATEFGGGVAGWNLADHEQYWATKRGSVGRAHPGCELRVVDAETGAPLGADEEGLLEVQGAPDGRRRGLDAHHRPRAHRRRRLRLDPRPRRPGDHPRRVQDPARRRARRARTRPARARRRGREPARRAARRGARRRGRAAARAPTRVGRRAARRGGQGARPLRAARRAAARRRRCRARRRARSTSRPCASCSEWRR